MSNATTFKPAEQTVITLAKEGKVVEAAQLYRLANCWTDTDGSGVGITRTAALDYVRRLGKAGRKPRPLPVEGNVHQVHYGPVAGEVINAG